MPNLSYHVPADGKFRLADLNPDSTDGFKSKADAEKKLAEDIVSLAEMQAKLYAQNTYGVLVIFQAMDTAGKDGAIKHVLTGVNPQGIDVHNFRVPNAEELHHDYLWRCAKLLPERGRIGIFNRSYYEELLTVRVHPEALAKQNLPRAAMTKHIWQHRFEDINNWESYLTRNGIRIVKFYLHISKEEQKERLMERIDDEHKNYKITPQDISERGFWDDYMKAYDDMLRNTSTEAAPWYAIPSNHKWFTRTMVADVLVKTLKSLDLEYPKSTKAKLKEIAEAKQLLENEKS